MAFNRSAAFGTHLFACRIDLGVDLAPGHLVQASTFGVLANLADDVPKFSQGSRCRASFLLLQPTQAFAKKLTHGAVLLLRQARGGLELLRRKRDGNAF